MRSTTRIVARKSSIGGGVTTVQGVFNTSNWGAWRFVWGKLSPPKAPPWRRDWVPPDHLGSEISFLHTCTIPKHCENIKTKKT